MRWLILAMFALLVACNSNNNGTNSQGTTVHQEPDDEDPHEMRPGIFYCVRLSSPDKRSYPCWRQLANCEKNRAIAIKNTYDATKCTQTGTVSCFEWRSSSSQPWNMDCRGASEDCDVARKMVLVLGDEVTACKRPEAHRRRPRQWRMARRATR